jgi:hypothetical protein
VLAYDVPSSRRAVSRVVSLVLASALSTGATPRTQEAAPSGVFGTWKGTATLTNDSSPTTCRYEGAADSLVLKLQSADAGPRAIVRLEIAGTAGSGCPPLHKRYEATNVVVTGSAVSFLDPAGHEWHLALREGRLVGLVSWKGGGNDEPLAEGFAPPGGAAPLTRLSGEVSLDRAASEEGGSGTAAGTTNPAAATPKKKSHFLPAFLAANIVGLGAFYGIKKATDDTGGGGTATCSPRFCVFGGLSDPCVCNINITAGASCGQTTSGVPFGGVCNDTTLPCQATLSCNNGICDDKFGRCPY